MPESIRFTIEQGIARITLDRTERRNALTRDMIVHLTACANQAAHDDAVRLICLAANGSVFCAGMDLDEMQERSTSQNAADEWLTDSRVYCDLLIALLDSPKPVLTSVQGPVLAGGVGIVLASDLVIATETTFFSLPEPQRGIVAAMVTPLLTYRVGVAHASHLLLSGRRVMADQAATIGLCHQVARCEALDDLEAEWIESILRGSPMALASTKAQIREIAGSQLSEQLEASAALSAAARESADAREGLQAFLEKRKPNWQQP